MLLKSFERFKFTSLYIVYHSDYIEGFNQRIHELLLKMTRCSVCMIISVFFMAILEVYLILCDAYIYPYVFAGRPAQIQTPFDILCMILYALDDITYLLGIYWIYEFGHKTYEYVLGCCHRKMYKFCEKRLDGSLKNESGSCCCSCRERKKNFNNDYNHGLVQNINENHNIVIGNDVLGN